MNKGFILALIFFLGIIGTVAYVYFKYEKPKQDLIAMLDGSNISISASYSNKFVVTGYVLSFNNQEVRGNTSLSSYQLERIPPNVLLTVTNENLEGQSFYVETKHYNLTKDSLRVDFFLEKPEELTITINDTKPLEVFLYSKNYNNITACLSSSFNYIFLKIINQTEIIKNKQLEGWDSCYSINGSLKNSNLTLLVDYTVFSSVGDKDYINLLLLSDQINQTVKIK